jgi:nitrate/nitrite-specific signal transduction histidine kinase
VEQTQLAALHEQYALRQAQDLRYLEAQIDRLELSEPGSEASSWQATREELEELRQGLRAAWEGLERMRRLAADSPAWHAAREAYLHQHTALLQRTLALGGAGVEGTAAQAP